jgi:hypothetical protein
LILALRLEKSNVGAKGETEITESAGLAWREEEDMDGMKSRGIDAGNVNTCVCVLLG